MPRILFVDDESNLLQGLQRILRSMRNEWDMTFVGSGHQALECLEKGGVDILVSDARMPGMDGVQLLTQTRQQYPTVFRVLLSGQADELLSMQATGVAHQFLAKPCGSDELIATLTRLGNLNDLLMNPQLKQVAGSMQAVPSMPALYAELCRVLESPESSIEDISKIISKDMGMTAQILHLVNSAFFGLSRTISDPSQAVAYLGLATVKSVVLSIEIFQQFRPPEGLGFSFDRLWEHCFSTGAQAQSIAQAEGLEDLAVGDAMAGGLLHDVGLLILASELPDLFERSIRLATEQHVLLSEAEREIYGSSHAEFGAYLLGLWGLRYPVVEAVAYHHAPTQAGPIGMSPLTAVHVADALESRENPVLRDTEMAQLDESYINDLGLSARLPVWMGLGTHAKEGV